MENRCGNCALRADNMEHATKERLISIISCDKLFVKINLSDNRKLFALRSPTSEEKALAALEYDEALNIATSEGMITEDGMLDMLEDRGIWTLENEQVVHGLQQDITTIKRGMLDFLFQTDKLERVRQTLRRAEQALIDRLVEKRSHLNDTAEAFALLQEQRFIIQRITQDEDGSPFWPNRKVFDECTDIGLISFLCRFYFQSSHFDEAVLRELARSNPWRSVWNSAKNIGQLFNNHPPQWTYNQAALASWSHSYDVAFEAYERPSNEVIEDDDLLDSWFIRQSDKVQTRAQQDSAPKITSNRKSGRQEIFIPTSPDKAKKVYDLNEAGARRVIKAKQRLIREKGKIKEQHMPDSQMEMRETLMQLRKQHIKGKSK